MNQLDMSTWSTFVKVTQLWLNTGLNTLVKKFLKWFVFQFLWIFLLTHHLIGPLSSHEMVVKRQDEFNVLRKYYWALRYLYWRSLLLSCVWCASINYSTLKSLSSMHAPWHSTVLFTLLLLRSCVLYPSWFGFFFPFLLSDYVMLPFYSLEPRCILQLRTTDPKESWDPYLMSEWFKNKKSHFFHPWQPNWQILLTFGLRPILSQKSL